MYTARLVVCIACTVLDLTLSGLWCLVLIVAFTWLFRDKLKSISTMFVAALSDSWWSRVSCHSSTGWTSGKVYIATYFDVTTKCRWSYKCTYLKAPHHYRSIQLLPDSCKVSFKCCICILYTQQTYYPNFLESSIYLQFLNELVHTLKDSPQPIIASETDSVSMCDHESFQSELEQDLDDPDSLWKRATQLP